jgi:hypothetical protein
MNPTIGRVLGVFVCLAALLGLESRAAAQADVVTDKMVMKLEAVTNRTVARCDLILAATMQRVALLRSRGVPEVKILAMLDKVDLQLDRTLAGVRLSIDKTETAGVAALARFGSPAEEVLELNAAADRCHQVVTEAQTRADTGLAAWRTPG